MSFINPVMERINVAINELKQGKMIILTDHPDREDEADLILPAENITPEIMNFMLHKGNGIICLSLLAAQIQKLGLELMVPTAQNNSTSGTPFTISIDAKEGITTGVSAIDRTKTVLAAIADHAGPEHIVKPGHLFPLKAHADGVLKRGGHTEGSIDIVKLAGFKPAAVICEIMNEDGTMTRGKALHDFAQRHDIKMLAIEDLVEYRLSTEDFIKDQAETSLPTEEYGSFKLIAFKDRLTQSEHIALIKNRPLNASELPSSTLVRIHSACMTGDLFHSLRCDCNQALQYSLSCISKEGGVLIYLNQEGRGIGLLNKIKAYALQDEGYDTVEANVKLGLPIDAREYYIAANFLRNLKISKIRLLTNNPNKLAALKQNGLVEVKRESMPVFNNQHNQMYLNTKQQKLFHLL